MPDLRQCEASLRHPLVRAVLGWGSSLPTGDLLVGDETTDLIDLAPPEYREQIIAGEIEVLPGQNPLKPVVRWADGPQKGQILAGSGRYPRANDIAQVSKETAVKRTKSYQEAMNLLMDADAGPDVKGSFAWWYEQAMDAAQGHPTTVTVICPHANPDDPDAGCKDLSHSQRVIVQKKDGNLIFRLLELKHGKAKETVEVNAQTHAMIQVLEQRDVVVTVYDVGAEALEERTRFVENLIERAELGG